MNRKFAKYICPLCGAKKLSKKAKCKCEDKPAPAPQPAPKKRKQSIKIEK